MMKDIISTKDIKLMIDAFYLKVHENKELSSILKKLAKKKWNFKKDILYVFWEKLLFGEGGYEGDPFKNNIPILIDEKDFEKFVSIFNETIDELFEGDYTESAKARILAISNLFQGKLKYIKPIRHRRTKVQMQREKKDGENEN